ncbi:hypothetical protein GCM10027614_27600 [Micromonospora vulcania]
MTGAGSTPTTDGRVGDQRPQVCAVVLAAGEGTRLRPLTERVPKALCPVGNVPLLDRALARLAGLGLAGPGRVAVNACYLADQVVTHVGDRAHLSVEPGDPLGTAGGVANLRDWIDGRPVLVGNADAYLADPTAPRARISPRYWTAGTGSAYACSVSPPRTRPPPARSPGTASPVSRCCPGGWSATCRLSSPTWYARSGGRPRRPGRWRWCPTRAPSTTPAPRPTT